VLLGYAEELAREHGAAYIALDTSELALNLIAFYERRGYRFVEHVRWPEVNYRSVIMAKPLDDGSGRRRQLTAGGGAPRPGPTA
jgi:hypothetical protein